MKLLEQTFMDGALYFRGRPMSPRELGGSFGTTVNAAATRILPDLYPHFTGTAVTDGELAQLLGKTLTGPPAKFLDGDLGILSLDAGRYVPTCAGPVPSRILGYIEEQTGTSGATLFAHFGRPPFGFPADVIRACLAGLLRSGKIRIQPEQGPVLTSVNDPGANDHFRQDRPLRRAELFPAGEGGVSARDRISICKFFKDHLDVEVERENDAIANAVHQLRERFPWDLVTRIGVESQVTRAKALAAIAGARYQPPVEIVRGWYY